ncbi:hypothetical protein Taro_033400 [Colocasia esculenta]|uniref:Uncharacterized protein n=1 Tax=Colocasia esculenta TaxID=4460 RepID=A0A843W6W3_COLES|nr:hypothetical protein [Colocasia esculenta]
MWRNGGRRTRNGLYIYLGFRRLVGEALSPPGEGFEREREGVEGMEGREGRGGEMLGVRLFGVSTLESVPMVSLNKTQKGSKEILLHQDSKKEEASDFMEDKQMALEPKVPQTLSLMLSAPQSTVSSKLHPNQTPFPQELQPLPCCPAQANKPHYIAEGNDLELSIAPPKPHSLSKVLSQNGVGAIRVV